MMVATGEDEDRNSFRTLLGLWLQSDKAKYGWNGMRLWICHDGPARLLSYEICCVPFWVSDDHVLWLFESSGGRCEEGDESHAIEIRMNHIWAKTVACG